MKKPPTDDLKPESQDVSIRSNNAGHKKKGSATPELLNSTLVEIISAIAVTHDLDLLYEKIHQLLNRVVDATNFFIAFNNPDETIRFAYFVDAQTPGVPGQGFPVRLNKGSLTRMVIEEGKPLLIKKNELLEFCREHDCEPNAPISEIWMGIPIRIKNEVIGVMALQSYSDPHLYTKSDVGFLSSVSVQLAMAIERKWNDERPKISDSNYQDLLENIKDAIYTTDFDGRVSYISPAITQITAYSPNELNGKYRWSSIYKEGLWSEFLVHPDDRLRVEELLRFSIETMTPFEIEYRIIRKDGKPNWISENGQFSRGHKGDIRLDGIITDIQEKKQAGQINSVLFSISNAVNTTFDLSELYEKIHEALSHIINVENFYIAMYSKEKDIISFPFDTDKIDEFSETEIIEASKSASLTAELIRSGEPVLLTKDEQLQHAKKLGKEFQGTPSELWLGVPLKVKSEVIGAMVIQSYTDSKLYGEKEAALLVSVSDQVAIAIERKQAEEKLRLRELLITSLYNISNAIHTTSNLDQLYQSIHESLINIIDARNFSIALYDKEKDILHFKYSVDEVDKDIYVPMENVSKSASLTYEVIRLGEPLLLDDIGQLDLVNKLKGELLGVLSKSWLGVPLKGKKEILGVVVTQDYNDYNRYKKRDIELLTSVSGQIAFAIEHKRAEAELAVAQKELIEKAHKAGMADIANGTLHNVGNILNSMKISTDILADTNRKTQVSSLNKANDLLQENMGSLDEFIGKDPKGKKLMEYYLKIGGFLNKEQERMRDHLDRLNEKIELINKVILAQQKSYSETGSMFDEYHVEEIVGDVLEMQAGYLDYLGITVIRKFAKVPKVLVQKTKLIHVIDNLVKNAGEAMLNTPKKERELIITLEHSDRYVRLKLSDTGEGIPGQNLNKIFNHGFSTKEDRNGFGLHNSANFISEMNGNIRAESKGANKGAEFIIEVPIKR